MNYRPELFALSITLASLFGSSGANRSLATDEPKGAGNGLVASLKMVNEKGKETVLSAEALAKLPRLTVLVKDRHGNSATYEGPALAEVVRSAGITLGKELRGPLLANYLLVEAADGYQVVFAVPEIDPEMTSKVVLLADRKDGKPLSAVEGPYRLVVPDEKRPARWVRQVVRISVGRASPRAANDQGK
jgi:hypothetical protein